MTTTNFPEPLATPDPLIGSPLSRHVSTAPSKLADYYELTKPRMNFLIVITTTVGFYMAATPATPWFRLLHTAIGTLLCASCAAIANQFIERGYDALMPRTKNRPLPAGRLNLLEALLFGAACGIAGFSYLFLLVNPLTAFLGALTIILYIFIYTPLKRISSLNTIVGAIPGAIPPVMGFTAAQNHLSTQALSIFGILFLWQMPHFLAIAIMYKDDYAAAGFKMLPVVDDSRLSITSRQILLYAAALLPMSLTPVLLHMAGPLYFAAALLLGLAFLYFSFLAATTRTRPNARKLFFASILYLPLLLAFLMLDKR
jgi:protoheme IX farnesyltransferase